MHTGCSIMVSLDLFEQWLFVFAFSSLPSLPFRVLFFNPRNGFFSFVPPPTELEFPSSSLCPFFFLTLEIKVFFQSDFESSFPLLSLFWCLLSYNPSFGRLSALLF